MNDSTSCESTTNDTFIFDYKAPAKPVRSVTDPPTKADRKVWDYYQSLGSTYGREFYRTLATIAKEAGVSESAVQRANQRFRELGQLSWDTGHGALGTYGEANRYTLKAGF